MGDRLASWRIAPALILIAFVAAASCSGDSAPTSSPQHTSAPGQTAGHLPAGIDATVVSVTDGDTIRVRFDSGDANAERVRLTGINTPETKDPRKVVECFGAEASAETHKLLPQGTAVRLETDVETRDRFGRFLAYVWRVDDALFVNAALVKGGWAAPFRYPPNVKYADRFTRLGTEAREAQRGLWGACGDTNTPASTSVPPTTTNSGGCDPNYAGACVPISSTDLDCSDIGVHDFQVVGTDIHGFDGDHDGIACETVS